MTDEFVISEIGYPTFPTTIEYETQFAPIDQHNPVWSTVEVYDTITWQLFGGNASTIGMWKD